MLSLLKSFIVKWSDQFLNMHYKTSTQNTKKEKAMEKNILAVAICGTPRVQGEKQKNEFKALSTRHSCEDLIQTYLLLRDCS